MKKIPLLAVIATTTVLLTGGQVAAQTATAGAGAAYPNRSIRIVLPWPAGGITDVIMRAVNIHLTEAFGQQLVIDNRPGAGGTLGVALAAKAPADGYTLVIGPVGNLAVNPHLFPNLPYDVMRDFTPITSLASFSNVLVVHPEVPAKSVNELIALAKAKPKSLSYGSPGVGSQAHLAGEFLRLQAGIDIVHIAYNGTAPALRDLLGGQIQFMFAQTSSALPQIQSGKLRALGVASPRRTPLMPELPTIAEGGLPGFEAVSWYALLAPAGTPREIVARIQAEVARVLQMPDVREKLAAQGAEPVGNTPEQLAAQIRTESARYADVVKRANIKAE